MLECVDLARWLVPTESIDEFCMLWQLEMDRPMWAKGERINAAPEGVAKRKELQDIVANMPDLYAVDLLLWQIARQRYDDYKYEILRKRIANPYPDNWERVWHDAQRGIWLGRNWHHPQEALPHGLAYWAGAGCFSEIRIRRNMADRYLVLSIIVYCGVHDHEISFLTKNDNVLRHYFQRIDGGRVVYAVDLDGLDENEIIWLHVPRVCSPAMVDLKTTDTSRKSVATCNWELAAALPCDVTVADAPANTAARNLRNLHAGDGHGFDPVE